MRRLRRWERLSTFPILALRLRLGTIGYEVKHFQGSCFHATTSILQFKRYVNGAVLNVDRYPMIYTPRGGRIIGYIRNIVFWSILQSMHAPDSRFEGRKQATTIPAHTSVELRFVCDGPTDFFMCQLTLQFEPGVCLLHIAFQCRIWMGATETKSVL